MREREREREEALARGHTCGVQPSEKYTRTTHASTLDRRFLSQHWRRKREHEDGRGGRTDRARRQGSVASTSSRVVSYRTPLPLADHVATIEHVPPGDRRSTNNKKYTICVRLAARARVHIRADATERHGDPRRRRANYTLRLVLSDRIST